jgi:ribosomal protein S18 acetylase RimI-like enzyme
MDEIPLVVGEGDRDLRERLDREIIAFNVAVTGYRDARLLSIAVRDDQRGNGLGTRLLATAEAEIRRRGCDRVTLDTHSFQAPDFYARLGYTECGRTPGYPNGYDHIHLVKRLD